MKKFYFIALAAAMSVSASAVTRSQLGVEKLQSNNASLMQHAALSKIANMEVAAPRHKAAAASTVADMAGTYTYTFKWLLQGSTPAADLIVTVDDEATGAVSIAGFPQNYELKGTIDLAAGTLTIPNDQNLGADGNGDINYFYLKGADSAGNITDGKIAQAATVGEISGNKITFPTMDIWAIGDYNQESLGWWWLSYTNAMELQVPDDPNVDPNEGWTSLGNATLQDGWVLPAFGIDQMAEENWYEVELQQNDADKSLYRLVDPYRGNCPVVSYNTSTAKHGYIVFDISDPEHVVFMESEAGFANSQMGVSKFYPFNSLGWAVGYLDVDANTIVDAIGDELDYTTYKDGIVTLSSTYGPLKDSEGNVVGEGWTNDACFGLQGEIYAGYTWTQQSKPANMETRIAFPGHALSGVNNVAVESDNAPVEYFTIQGLRVAEPQSGSLVICRQGDKISKVIVK